MKNSETTAFSNSSVKRATIWAFSGEISANILRLCSNLIMTRLLVPELFGVMAAANLIFAAVALLSDIGLSQSTIRSKNAEKPSFIGTVWSLQIIRGLSIGTFLLLVATLFSFESITAFFAGTAYGNPQFRHALYIIAAYAIIVGLQSPHIYFLERRLELKKKIFIELFAQVVGILSGILYALFIARDINALLIAMIMAVSTSTLLSHLIISGKVSFQINKVFFYEIFHYGKWIIVSSALGFLTLNGNQIILSFYVDEKTLGIFSIATFILLALSQVTGKVFGSVFFPMLSQSARLGAEHIEASYLKIKRKIDPIIFFLATFFYFSGEALITLIYDSRYEEAGGILSILSLSLIALCSRVTFQLYFALGLSKVTSTIALINTSLLFTIVPLVLYWSNLNYALWAMALVSASRALIAFYYEYRYFSKLFINPLFITAAIIAGWGSGQLFSTVILALKAMI